MLKLTEVKPLYECVSNCSPADTMRQVDLEHGDIKRIVTLHHGYRLLRHVVFHREHFEEVIKRNEKKNSTFFWVGFL